MASENQRDLRPDRLALPADGSLRQGLVSAFSGVLAYAQAQDPREDPTRAVHELRKSVRRARALLRLMEGFVGVDAYQVLSSSLREVHRSTSDLRDRHVVLDVLQGLGVEERDDAGVARAAGELAAGIQASPAPGRATVEDVLARGSRRLEVLPRLLAGAMPGKVAWYAVEDGLARTHRRARRRLGAVRRDGDDSAVHSLRKRIKELTYQVELFTGAGGKLARRRRKQLSRLSEELGHVVDLMVLRDYAVQHLAIGDDLARFLDAIESERAARLGHALDGAAAILDIEPRRYAGKIIRAARAGRA